MSRAKKSYRVVAPDRYLRVADGELAVTVRHDGEVFARSTKAVRLLEGDRDGVFYLPRADIERTLLVPSERRYDCRWKGRATYFHVDLRDRTLENVVWGYPDAPDAVAALRDRVAFDAAVFDVRVDAPADESAGRPTGRADEPAADEEARSA